MAAAWTSDQLQSIEDARELEITTARSDETLRKWVPIWAVTVGEEVYVRTWLRRTSGWFGHAVANGRARIRVRDLEGNVLVEDVGDADAALRAAVDEAYRSKYGGSGSDSGGRMTGEEAAATTLRLSFLPAS